MAAPKTPMARQSRSVSSRNGTAIAMKMMIPPMVGVPALAWWPSGPSSRMFWPNSRSRRNSMNFGERKMQSSSEAVPAMSTSPTGRRLRLHERLGHGLQRDAARALDEHHVARADEIAREGGRLGGVGGAQDRGGGGGRSRGGGCAGPRGGGGAR